MKEAAPTSSASFPRRRQFSLRQLMIVVFVLNVLTALGVLGYRASLIVHSHTRKDVCKYNLMQIGVALHTYHDIWNCFPPVCITDKQDKPMHSWRVSIWPQCESQPYFAQYDMSEPWNGPKNSRLHVVYPPYWRCPEDSSSAAGMTNYVAITGPGTGWPGPNQSSRISDFKDGLANSIMVVEIRNSDIHWMEPRDLDIRTLQFAINSDGINSISSRHIGGAFVLYADGSVEYLSDQETEARLRKMVLIADEEAGSPQGQSEK